MASRLRITIITVLLAGLVSASSTAQDLPLPEKWTTHYAWFLVTNPDYVAGSSDDERALTSAHIQYQLRLQAAGRAIVSGGLGEGPHQSIVGLTVLRADSLAQARTVADADPAVRAGRLVSWVREWWVPAGRLPTR